MFCAEYRCFFHSRCFFASLNGSPSTIFFRLSAFFLSSSFLHSRYFRHLAWHSALRSGHSGGHGLSGLNRLLNLFNSSTPPNCKGIRGGCGIRQAEGCTRGVCTDRTSLRIQCRPIRSPCTLPVMRPQASETPLYEGQRMFPQVLRSERS